MRFKWDEEKDKIQRKKWGIGFEQVSLIFSQRYYLDQKNDDPEQYRAIGWCGLDLISVIFEEREDHKGPFYWLVTFWRSAPAERKLYEEG